MAATLAKEVKLSLTNTRANAVYHALARLTCPFCNRPLTLDKTLLCDCGFVVASAEIDQHLRTIDLKAGEHDFLPA